MNYPELIAELQKSGLTQLEIGEAVGCGHTTISAIKAGQIKNTGFGLALFRLLEKHCPSSDLLKVAT